MLQKLYRFYYDGFSNMTIGKTLWIIVLLKLFIMFVVLKTFFFPNYLNTNFENEQGKANHVRQELIEKKAP
jgi:Na+/H+ antiporter NhaD/arsenite permease-like protein